MYICMYVCMCTCVNMCVCVYVCMMAQFHWESAWGRGPGLGNSIGDLLGEGGPGLANSIGNLLGDLSWSGQFHAEFAWVGLDWAVPLGISLDSGPGVPNSTVGNRPWTGQLHLEISLESGLRTASAHRNLFGHNPWGMQFRWESAWGGALEWPLPLGISLG